MKKQLKPYEFNVWMGNYFNRTTSHQRMEYEVAKMKMKPQKKVYTTADRKHHPSFAYKEGYNQAIDDMHKWLSRERFHSIVCEYVPGIASDSEQPEWTKGELDKLYDDLILGEGIWSKINE